MKKLGKAVAAILLAVLLTAGGYLIYAFSSYYRLGDQIIVPEGEGLTSIASGQELKLVSWNIGFGAYEQDYDFFMDGGKQSRAPSEERLDSNLRSIGRELRSFDADMYFIQEVDFDATRSYHIDERPYLKDALPGYAATFAQNYDSPYLMYPVFRPHGASKSGMLTFSSAEISSAHRVELPVESGIMKFLDLDRCFCKNRIALADGKELVLFNFHFSAYTSDGTIATEQLKILLEDMENEYDAGNYCVAGGDFNKDILGDSSVYFGKGDREYTWAQPIPEGVFDRFDVVLQTPLDVNYPVPSCRNPDSAYHEGQYVLTVDGFMISPNVTVTDCGVIDEQFLYSDHNPVFLSFILE